MVFPGITSYYSRKNTTKKRKKVDVFFWTAYSIGEENLKKPELKAYIETELEGRIDLQNGMCLRHKCHTQEHEITLNF